MCGREENSEFNCWVLVLEKSCSTERRDCVTVQIWHDQHVFSYGFRTPARKGNLYEDLL